MRQNVQRRGNAVPRVIDAVPSARVSRNPEKRRLSTNASSYERTLIGDAGKDFDCQKGKRNPGGSINVWESFCALDFEKVVHG